MQKLFISVLVAAFSINTFAAVVDWREVESKQCGYDEPVAVKDESIAVIHAQSLIAFKKKDEAGCNYADFYSILMVGSGVSNDKTSFTYIPVQAVSRKNCRNEMSTAPAPNFTMIQYEGDSIVLNNAEGCQTLWIKLKPQSAPATQPENTHTGGPQE